MDRYFASENDNEYALPSVRKIERAAFSVDGFNVDEFLLEYHHYQTLEDMQEQLKSWSKTLEHELVDLINEDYSQFVGLGTSLSEGHPKIEDVKMELMSFQQEVKVRFLRSGQRANTDLTGRANEAKNFSRRSRLVDTGKESIDRDGGE